MSTRLTNRTLDSFTAIQTPSYDRSTVTAGILHIGTGGFHRAHQAVYTDDILATAPEWGIIGTSLRSSKVRDQLLPQDFLYSVATRSPDAEQIRVIGSIRDVLTLEAHRHDIVAAMASGTISVITLTITEKGYCHTASGILDDSHPDIMHDSAAPQSPVSAPGLLVLGLQARREKRGGPLTILSCDNLASNGRVLQAVVLGLADKTDPTLRAWCDEHVSFASSMVDRIVPATTDKDRQHLQAATGIQDNGVVICEPFRQWIIEDNFAGARPPWDQAGALFVDDVTPFEKAKLRFLNATHSALAYLGLLSGYGYIHEAMSDDTLASFASYLMDEEITAVIDAPPGLDLTAYKSSILQRFSNNAIAYGTAQVATDGSKKLPQRIIPTIMERHAAGMDSPALCLVIAAWLCCLRSNELSAGVPDPASELIQSLNEDGLVKSVTAETDLLAGLGNTPEIVDLIAQSYSALADAGPAQVVARITG